MSFINFVFLLGNLTRDPELSYTPQGKPVTKFSLAVSNSYVNAAKVKVEKPLFIDCTVWNKQAESLAQYKKKGDGLMIQGRLELDQWEVEGTKHRKHKVVASRVVFMQNVRRGADEPRSGQSEDQDERPEPGGEDIPF